MDFLKIALLQIAPCRTQEANLKKGTEYCRRAKSLGADIVLFPEMWSNGYGICGRPAGEWMRDAIPADGDFVNTFGKTARELEIAVGITFLEKYGEGARNTLVLFDRFGKKRLTYAKVHTCDFGAERSLTPGEAFYTVDLDTACGPVKVGAMICYDREFPESARILMLQGAELILVPNACPMEINRISQLRGRAYENMLAVATCNYPATVPDCNGHSIYTVCSHGYGICSDKEPVHEMEKVLFAADELTGLIWAAALMRPSKSVMDMEVSSVKKKFKDKRFAAGCSRDVIKTGAERLGWELNELFEKTILAMRSCEAAVQNEMREMGY